MLRPNNFGFAKRTKRDETRGFDQTRLDLRSVWSVEVLASNDLRVDWIFQRHDETHGTVETKLDSQAYTSEEMPGSDQNIGIAKRMSVEALTSSPFGVETGFPKSMHKMTLLRPEYYDENRGWI